METESQAHQPEPQTAKRGVLRAYLVIFSLEAAILALLWAIHLPGGVVSALCVVAFVAAMFNKQLTGTAEHVQIASPTFEHRISNRYGSASNQLLNLQFTPLFFYGEAFPLFRLFLIYPAFLFLIMLLNREVAAVQNGSKLVFGFPVFNSGDRSTYAHPNQLGMKFHTLFQDGTILLTKNFGGKTKYPPAVVVHCFRSASISDTWAEHEKQIWALEATGKQINREISFQAYSNISREA